MKTDKPFRKSFICAGVLSAIITIIMIATGASNVSYRIGFVLGTCLFAGLVPGIWGFYSKKSWSWARFVATVIIFYVVFAMIEASGNSHK
jgi:hypothetical protein